MSKRIPHPPGPYTVEDFGDGYLTDICFGYDIPGAGSPVAIGFVHHDETADRPGDISPRQAEAIARLWAAAPDMLTALQAAKSFGLHGETDDGISVSYLIESAIAKATGATN